MKQMFCKMSVRLCSSVIYIFITLLFTSCQNQEKMIPNWTFQVGDRIQSTPVIDNEIVYFGSNDSLFYAVDATSGKELWRIKTGNGVRSQAAIKDSHVYFANGNDLFALDKVTGQEIWIHKSKDTIGSTAIDPWDYHQGSPILYNSEVFVGFGNGSLIGFDQQTGKLKFSFNSLDSSAIRSTPVIEKDVIYFGDWNGRVYAVDINSGDTLWTHRTYDQQPYSTFGMINTKMLIHDNLLIFGARNPEIQALNIHTGNVVWSHTETDGGWISGDPVVTGDTMYIGGSDNHRLIAFNVYSGEIYWDYDFLFNNFSSPVVNGNFIFITTGNAYAFTGNYLGNGYLYALNRKDGSIKNMMLFDGNMFNAPVFFKEKIIVGGDDMTLRAIDYQEFTDTKTQFPENGIGPVHDMQIAYDTITNTQTLSWSMKFADSLQIQVLNLKGETIKVLLDEEQIVGKHTLSWDGKNEAGQFVADGYYFLRSKSGIFIKNKVTYFVNK